MGEDRVREWIVCMHGIVLNVKPTVRRGGGEERTTETPRARRFPLPPPIRLRQGFGETWARKHTASRQGLGEPSRLGRGLPSVCSRWKGEDTEGTTSACLGAPLQSILPGPLGVLSISRREQTGGLVRRRRTRTTVCEPLSRRSLGEGGSGGKGVFSVPRCLRGEFPRPGRTPTALSSRTSLPDPHWALFSD